MSTVRDSFSAARLALVSFLLLFLELALIRYLPSQVRVLSYFTNLVLLASFLGLGVGSLLARLRPRLLALTPVLLAGVLYLARVLAEVLVVERAATSHYLWTVYVDLSPTARSLGMTPVLIAFFVAVAIVFVPLGQELGRLFRLMAPLRAYSIDILGSMAGSICLTLLAAASLPPLLWFGLGGGGLLVAVAAGAVRRPLAIGIAAAGVGVSMWLLALAAATESWTPYYRIRTCSFEGGFDVTVNASLHQTALDLSPARCASTPEAAYIRDEYARPYELYRQVHGRAARNVLILGAGSGNDAAVALQEGVSKVVAVEIDPVIADMGRELHPNHPYRDPRVRVVVTDARSFLRRTDERFDLVLFGTLDSQTLLSGMHTVRLDNYVYTRESLAEARARLADDGILGLFFMVSSDWISLRLYRMLEEADGRPPLIYRPRSSGQLHVTPIFNYVLFAGPGVARVAPEERGRASRAQAQIRLATDDWPYLYLREPSVPHPYPRVILILLGISVVSVLPLIPRTRSGRRGTAMTYFFFMGAGFMLLETKSITELSLLFGSTWKVNGVVISSVLITILAANLTSIRVDLSRARWMFPLLGLFLVVNYVASPAVFLELPPVMSAPVAGLYFALPIYAAGLLFARRFRTEPDPDRALGWNLIGAMTGGLIEYLSMRLGIDSLYVIAAVFYAGAFVFDQRGAAARIDPPAHRAA